MDITVPNLFKDIWQGLKDSTNYIVTAGDQPYLLYRKLRIDKKKFKPTPYWNWYSEIIKGENSHARFTKMATVYPEIGIGLVRGKKYIDFIWQGKKVVIPFEESYMKIEEERTAFKITAEKEKAIRQLKAAAQQAQDAINQIPVLAANLSKEKQDYYKKQQLALVEHLFRIDAIQVQAKKDTLTLSGLGIEPTTLLVVAASIVVVVSVLIIALSLESITAKIGYILQIKTQGDIVNNNIRRQMEADKMLAENKITPDQHERITKQTQENIKETGKRTEQILKTQKDQNKNSLSGTIQIIAWVGLGIVFIDALSGFIASKQRPVLLPAR